jgi:hypothetical protein
MHIETTQSKREVVEWDFTDADLIRFGILSIACISLNISI